MGNQDYTEMSKFLSYVLRHNPGELALSVDAEGWVVLDELIEKSKKKGFTFTKQIIEAILAESSKKRFAFSQDGKKIRALQGHSTPLVDIKYEEIKPPQILYHGTAQKFLSTIREQGLKAGSRHYVHLSATHDVAKEVGHRHGKAVVLSIQSLDMHDKGFKFFQAENGVWLTERVPVEFIEFN